jgi:mRNA interferase MazF
MSKAKSSVFPVRGEVWIVNLHPIVGHEQRGVRPALVVSTDRFNRSPAGLLMIAPITSTDRVVVAHVPVHPPEGGLAKTSFVMTDQLRTISSLRLGHRLNPVSSAILIEIEKHVRLHLGL